MKRVLSGIKPSGDVTLGNYLGAMKRWAEMSQSADSQNFFFIPNLHALNMRPDPAELLGQTLNAVAWLVAIGVDPDKSAIFAQSEVSAHAELQWILNNYVTFGELSRMTQFKDKTQRVGSEGQVAALFNYPVLMAADILLYDADEVPIGDDQKQHVELTRDIATRFNNLYGQTFKLPRPTLPSLGARIMNLANPEVKMSKSDEDNSGCILLSDSPETIKQKIMRAVTDSGSTIESANGKPAVTNLLVIYSLLSGKTVEQVEQDYAGKGYGEFKQDLAELAVSVLEPLQARFNELRSDDDKLSAALKAGKDVALPIAEAKIAEVKTKLGLL
ncbi:MAG TPA: tryptophan--tRNA ligase [Candidatus Nanoarchaeia archaeon]|nr:tryptophan--tRNA ligase [Candidatus Nanoarchaeia archaeon]